MKNVVAFLLLSSGISLAQDISIPSAPKRLEFADIMVNLTPQAQQLVNQEITSLLTPQNQYLKQKMARIQWYFPIIEEILEEEEVPDDFKYIAVLESSLDPTAVSTSGAVGYWQFKPNTATELGLQINSLVDERKEIFNSTHAAATYLKRSNLIYHNWISSLLSYNLGVAGISGKVPTEWTYAYEVTMDEATDRYLLKSVAHRIAFEHHLNRLRPSEYKFVEYPAQNVSLDNIARELTMDVNDLKKYNVWLSTEIIPTDKIYNVLIPTHVSNAKKIETKISNRRALASLDNGFPELVRTSPVNLVDGEPIFYKINGKKGIMAVAGDNVATLAKKAGTGVYAFLKKNDMVERDVIVPNKVYYLQKKGKKAKVAYHTVAENQTLNDISHMYGVTLSSLLRLNRLKSVQRMQPGRVVWLQKKRPKGQPIEIIEEGKTVQGNVIATTQPNKNSVIDRTQGTAVDVVEEPRTSAAVNSEGRKLHVVQQGESIYTISKKYGVTMDEIFNWNNLTTDALSYKQSLIVSRPIAKNTTTYSSGNAVPATNDNNTNTTYKDTYNPYKNSTPSQNTTPSSNNNSGTKFHTVQQSETLFRISKNYNVTVDDLKRWNNLPDNTISVGQRLVVSSAATSGYSTPAAQQQPSTSSATTHTVQVGETLYRISKNYNVNLDDLKRWNNLSDNTISVGQRLIIRK